MRNHLWWNVYRDGEWIGGAPRRAHAREMRDREKRKRGGRYRIVREHWDWEGKAPIPDASGSTKFHWELRTDTHL